MNIRLENVAKIKHADLKIDEITVLTGLNGMGKSTICKSIYMLLQSYSNLNEKIFSEKINSIYIVTKRFLEEYKISVGDLEEYTLASQLANQVGKTSMENSFLENTDYLEILQQFFKERAITMKAQQISELYEKVVAIIEKPKVEYLPFFISRAISGIFKNQLNYINAPELQAIMNIDFLNGKDKIEVKVLDNEITDYSKTLFNSLEVPIYLEPRSPLDDVANNRVFRGIRSSSNILELIMKEEEEQELSFEEFEKRQTNIQKVKEILLEVTQGKLVKNPSNGVAYSEVDISGDVLCTNVASGLKIFLMIQRLVENGSIDTNRLLIIDEPEVNLHPKWQLMLAQVLVLLNEEMGVKILLSTHSPYFLRAIEVYSKDNNRADKVKYFIMREAKESSRYELEEVTDNLEKVYKEMYYPLEELA